MKKLTKRQFLYGMGTAMVAPGLGRAFANSDLGQNDAFLSSLATSVKKLVAGRDVSLSILLPNGSQGNLNPVVRVFEQMTGVKVEFEIAPVDDINTRILLDTVSQAGKFDLALAATFGLPDLVEAGALTNLDEYATRYAPEDLEENSLYTLGNYVDDDFYGYQTDGDVYLMFYNNRLLTDADEQKRFGDTYGYKLAVPKTWQQLDEMMAYFHRPDQNQFGGALFRTAGYVIWEWWIRFHAKGSWPFDQDMKPQINNEHGVETLEELKRATRSLYPGCSTFSLFENWVAFAQGNIFCNIGWGGTQKYLNGPKSKIADNLTFGPTPSGEVDGEITSFSYFNWGWNYTVPSFAPEPEIAYLFTLFASNAEVSTRAVQNRDGYFDPFRTEHYLDKEIQKIYGTEFLNHHNESIKNAIPDLYLRRQGEYFDTLRDAIMLTLNDESTAKRALDQCANKWLRITRLAGLANQKKQWAFLRKKYPPAMQRILK